MSNIIELTRVIECACGEWEQLPDDEQRHHVQAFDWLYNSGDEGVYKCTECGKQVTSYSVENDSE